MENLKKEIKEKIKDFGLDIHTENIINIIAELAYKQGVYDEKTRVNSGSK